MSALDASVESGEGNSSEIPLEQENWLFDAFNDGVMGDVRKMQKEALQKCVNDYSKQLNKFAAALDAPTSSFTNYWNPITSNNCPIIDAEFETSENTNLSQLLLKASDDAELNKMLLVFTTLCDEIKYLKQLALDKYFPLLLFYGEDQQDFKADENDADSHEKITEFLPQIIECSHYIKRCHDVYRNFMCQLAAVYSKKQRHFLGGISITSLMDHVSLLLGILLRLDEIILFNQTLRDHWDMYKRMIKSIAQSPAMFSTTADTVLPLDKWLVEFEAEIFDQMILQNCISQNIPDSGNLFLNNKALKDHFTTAINYMLTEAETAIVKNSELAARSSLVNLIMLFCLHYHLFRELDTKMNKRVWDIMKKTAAINLYGPIVWYAPEFVLNMIPPSGKNVDKKVLAAIDTNRKNGLKDAPPAIHRHVHYIIVAVSQWQIKFEETFLRKPSSEKSVLDGLKNKTRICYQGLGYARSISSLIKIILPLYVDSGHQMSATVALQIMRLIEILKMIQLTFSASIYSVNKLIPLTLQSLQGTFLRNIQSVLRKFPKSKAKQMKPEVNTCVALLRQIAMIGSGPVNSQRLMTINLLLEVSLQKLRSHMRDDEISGLFEIVGELTKAMNFYETLDDCCDCMFLNWGKACVPVYLSSILTCKLQPASLNSVYSPSASGVPLLFAALNDIVRTMDKCDPISERLKAAFETEMLGFVDKHLIGQLKLEIETDLRYASHVHLKVKDSNPVKQAVVLNDLKPIVALKPFRFMGSYIDLAHELSLHLTQMFYNLTTITPQDWQAYTSMKFCAIERYGDVIRILDGKLPQQTLEQGLDVLEIMRNIDVFVCSYYYNLNNQLFVEQARDANRHVNTINIRHIANSMRTHGTGIMNTTVNYVFQYLRKHFKVFSLFLHDEHIKGKLIKEIRYFREKKDQLEQMYPYERAEKLNRNIRNLGKLEDNKTTYLDKFRQLISQIGNAMAFVRMIRSGGLNTCSHAIEFVPDLDDIVSFEEQVKAEQLSSETEEAAKNFDTCLENLSKNFAEGTDYFGLFVNVFAVEFSKAKNVHVKNFYVMVPALMINFVEHMKAAREQLMKKSKTGALFTDDGFAMGVSFVLAFLNQNPDFDSLHWFDSIDFKWKKDMSEVVDRKKTLNPKIAEDYKQLQTMESTVSRIELLRKEFELLFFSFSSARIFFQQPDPDEHHEDYYA
ncbi:WASH complex subunit 4-like isoform X1 [Convolutriloba macropyga]|uniref:WASH complex subunit 4-like isoform X1 n=1 Tax=Convolutriloba macropyga TaxID=536237 RepID=UPI003F524671